MREFVIIQSGPLDARTIELITQWFYQVQSRALIRAQADEIARVGWNYRPVTVDVQHGRAWNKYGLQFVRNDLFADDNNRVCITIGMQKLEVRIFVREKRQLIGTLPFGFIVPVDQTF